MKNLSLLLLAGALALMPVRVSGMIPRGGAEQGRDEEHGDKKFDPAKATEARTEEKQIEAAKEAALQGQGNPDLGNNNEVIEEETTVTWEENVDFQLNPLEQSAWDRLQPAAEVASASFNELLELPRDEEGNILDPSKQEELRPRILQALKAYEDQRQAWIAQVTSQRLAEVETLEKATKPITFEIVKDLDVGTEENGAVFWTGYTLENQRTAMAYAAEQGKKTIEMTRDGKLLDQLGMYKPDSPIFADGKSKLGDLLFDAVSTKFAQAAHGKVTAVIYKPRTLDEQAAYQRSAYARIEEPILLAREEVGEPVELGNGRVEVPVEITLPALRKLIKENAHQKKRMDLAGRLLSADNLSMEKIDRIDDLLNNLSKNTTHQHKLQQKAKSTDLTPAETSQLEEELQKTKTQQTELLNRLWNFADRAHARAQEAWQAATALPENNPSFWNSWETATETATEAHHAWGEYSQRTEQHIPESDRSPELSIKLNNSENQKNLWLEKLKTAKVEAPLKLEEEKKAVSLKSTAAISLPEPTEADEKRLELQRQIKKLKTKKEELKLPKENKETFETFLQPEERPRRSSSNARDLPLEREIDLSKKIKEITEEWEKEVRAAEKQRQEDLHRTGKVETAFSSDKKLFDLWREHDEKILQTRDEITAGKEKEKRNSLLAATWKSDTRRWNLRLQADELWERINAIDTLYRLHNQTSDYDDPTWREADDEILKIKKHLEQKLQATRIEWEQRAEEHPEVIKVATKGAKALSEAKEQLKKSDRVILELQKEFKDQIYQGKAYLRPRTLEPTADEIKLCEQALTEQREALLEKVNTHQISIEEYGQKLKRIALKDAKENAPGDCEAWEALKQSAGTFQTSEPAITTADRTAAETFFQERHYLDAIQKKWNDQLEELADRRQAAAKAFFQDDPLPWILLTPQERYYYNAPIRKAQEATAPRDIENAIAKIEQTYEAIRLLKSYASKATKTALEQEKENHYNNLKQLFEKQITESKKASHAAYQEVERLHAPEIQSFFSGPSTKQKQQAINDYVRATASLLELESQLNIQERKHDYEKIALPLEQQTQQEATLQAKEKAEREDYLEWLKLTPQEKKKKIEQLEKDKSTAESKKTEYWFQASQAERKGDPEKATHFKTAAGAAGQSCWRLENATKALEKTIEVERQGKLDVASFWNTSAKQYQLAADYWRQSMEATLQGDPEKATRFKAAAQAAGQSDWSLRSATEALKKAIEAERQGKLEVASLWKANAKQYQLAADYWRQSMEAIFQGDPEKATRFKSAAEAAGQNGWSLGKAIEALEETIWAEAEGKGDVASLWKASAKQYQLAADYWCQSMEATLQGDPEKATRFKTAAKAASNSGGSLKNATEALEKAIEAETQGKLEVASFWNTSAKQYQLAADYWCQSMEATLQGAPEKATRFKTAAEAAEKSSWRLEKATNALEKAIEAETQGKGDVASLWKASAKQYQLLADYWRQSMEATLQGDPEEATRFETAAEAAGQNGWSLGKATNALEKAIEAETQGKGDVASLWKASAKQYQLAADCWRQSMEATLQGASEKATHFETAAEAAELSGWSLEKATEALEKAIEAKTQGKLEVASLWKASAKQHQLAADYGRQSMEAILQGAPEKATHFKAAAQAAEKEAEAAEEKAKGQK